MKWDRRLNGLTWISHAWYGDSVSKQGLNSKKKLRHFPRIDRTFALFRVCVCIYTRLMRHIRYVYRYDLKKSVNFTFISHDEVSGEERGAPRSERVHN